jgi:hypothetical protein
MQDPMSIDIDDAFSQLPDELVLAIFEAIGDDPRTVASLALASRRYAVIARDPTIWGHMCAIRFPIALHERYADFGKDERWVYRARRCEPRCGQAVAPGARVIHPYRDVWGTFHYQGRVRSWCYYGDLVSGHAEGYGVGVAIAPGERCTVSTFADRPPPDGGSKGKYEGMWLQWPHGFGVYDYPDGGRYSGLWESGLRSGEGAMVWADGSTYRGHWHLDMMNGYGTLNRDGSVYEGQFVNDQCHGHGTETVPGDNVYTGDWRNGQRSGRGLYRSEQGWSYDGEWKRDERHGFGVWEDSTGDRYAGMWRADRRHGRGIHTWSNGQTHEGLWADDKPCGDGVRTLKDRVITGIWENDDIRGDAIIALTNGTCYVGKWTNATGSWGKGICTYPDGSTIDGTWREARCIAPDTVTHPSRTGSEACGVRPCMACRALASP